MCIRDSAYRIPLQNDATLQIGLQGSIRYLGLDFDDPNVVLTNNNDPSIIENMLSKQYLGNFGVGIYLNYEQFFFGASVPYLFPNDIGFHNDSQIDIAQETPHFYVTAGGMIPINNSISFKPAALAKIVPVSYTHLTLPTICSV